MFTKLNSGLGWLDLLLTSEFMMSNDNTADGLRENRVALADLTNQTRKRSFQFVWDNRVVKSGDGCGKSLDYKQGDSGFAKRVCQGVDNLMKGKCNTDCGSVDADLSLLKGKRAGAFPEDTTPLISDIANEIREKLPSNLLDNDAGLACVDVVIPSDKEVGNASRDSSLSNGSMPTGSEPSEGEGCDTGEKCQDNDQIIASDVARRGPSLGSCGNDGKGAVDKPMPSEDDSVDLLRLVESQESKSFELERCIGLNKNACSNLNVNANMIKACSCPFCLKAAYIWSDLHYQDIKGRIAALKKSKKEASILVQRSCRAKETDPHGHMNPINGSKLESELTDQWRSLFQSMADIFAHETNQLQSSFLTLKDLREDCKTNLELTNQMPSDKQ